jgi:hypothetical protein
MTTRCVYWFEVRDVTTGQPSLIYCPAAMTVGGRVTTTFDGQVTSLLNYGVEITRTFNSLEEAKSWVEMCWAGPRKRVGLA